MVPAPARPSDDMSHQSHVNDAFVWACRMVVRLSFIAFPVATLFYTLPYVAQLTYMFALCIVAFVTIALPCMLAVAAAAWRDLDHPSPPTRFEPTSSFTETCDKTKNKSQPIRRVAVIGGGAAGIATARQMKQQGFEVFLFERSDDVGGLWRFNTDTGKVFKNVTQNLTKHHNRFANFLPKKKWPKYLGHEQTQEYLSNSVDYFDLKANIKLNTEVTSVKERIDDGFEVTVRDVSPGAKKQTKSQTLRFDAVAVCTGQLTKPFIPSDELIPGLSSFTGTILHTSQYKDCTPFSDQKVCIVGMGSASGSDVAQDVCVAAEKTVLAVRTHRWLMRRGVTGGKESLLLRITQSLPTWVGLLLALYTERVPSLKNLQFTPGATDSGDVLAYVALGKIFVKPAVAKVTDDVVTFTDGTSETFDVLLFATGFLRETTFLDPDEKDMSEHSEHFRKQSGTSNRSSDQKNTSPSLSPHRLPGVYKGVLSSQNPRLAFILFVLPFGSHFQVADAQAKWAALVWGGELGTPGVREMKKFSKIIQKTCSHEALGEFYRVQYFRLLSLHLFPKCDSFMSVCWKVMTSVSSSKYIDPVLEWGTGGRQETPRVFDTKGKEDADVERTSARSCKRGDWRAWSFA